MNLKFLAFLVFFSINFFLFSQTNDKPVYVRNDIASYTSSMWLMTSITYERKLFSKGIIWAGTGFSYCFVDKKLGIPIDLTFVTGKNKNHVDFGPFLNISLNGNIYENIVGLKVGYRYHDFIKNGLMLRGGIEMFRKKNWDDDYMTSIPGISPYFSIGYSF